MSERDVLARAIDALPRAPQPPSVARVWDGVRAADVARRRAVARLAVAATVLVALGSVALVASKPRTADRTADDGASLAVGATSASRDARRLRLVDGERTVRLDLDADASVTRTAPREVTQAAGRVRYEVAHATGTAFTVRAGGVEIVDVGTRFAVDLAPVGASVRTLVTVDEGEVAANGVPLRAGRGLAFLDGKPSGASWALDAKPVVGVEVEGSPQAGLPIVVRVSLENPTDGWLTMPERDGLRAPLFLEVRGPDGALRPVRVTESMVLERGGPGTAIPPRGRAVVRIRFDHTFASTGTYRLRAVYRPADAVDAPASPETTLTVR
jgi:hypothetical protein